MIHPFQCIASINHWRPYLLAACGPDLLSVSLDTGEFVSKWSPAAETPGANASAEDEGNRSAKRQKTSHEPPQAHNIIKLTVSPDQYHAVAVTDDKCVRVFSIGSPRASITELSKRYMPKRPCAIQVHPDNATIICGDKFGDVYSLPLHPAQLTKEDLSFTEQQAPPQEKSARAQQKSAAFKPSASHTTVHTQRNKRALDAQMAQKDFSARKEPLKFEHKLLLGHVSMLTDVLVATREVEGKQRSYIITADRDEHIRVSRGEPQAHVIEHFLLGHTEYISKLCLIPGTDRLVSGGGDEFLCSWDWPSGRLMKRIDLHKGIMEYMVDVTKFGNNSTRNTLLKADSRINISGLWHARIPTEDGGHEGVMLVACERVPTLFVIQNNDKMTRLTLDYPPLDVACIGDTVIVSCDVRKDGDQHQRLQAFKLVDESVKLKHIAQPRVSSYIFDNGHDEMRSKLYCLERHLGPSTDDNALDGLLYGVANLRKRRGWDTPMHDGDEEAAAEEGL